MALVAWYLDAGEVWAPSRCTLGTYVDLGDGQDEAAGLSMSRRR